jgi:hypothetical protein
MREAMRVQPPLWVLALAIVLPKLRIVALLAGFVFDRRRIVRKNPALGFKIGNAVEDR